MNVGKKFEVTVAKELDGRLTPASGAMWGAKGDASRRFLRPAWWTGVRVEAKSTAKDSFSLKKSTLKKITNEALARGELPVLAVEISGDAYGLVELSVLMDMIKLTERVSELDNLSYLDAGPG